MAYVTRNYKTKKALKEAIAAGERLGVYNPSGMYPVPDNGRVTVEGPWYPQPHSWYAVVWVKDGVVAKVVS